MEADMATTKNEMLDALLQRMDDALANGKRLPWQKPWEPKFGDLSAPHNPTTERLYSPFNGLILSTAALERGYEDPRWMGFNQAKEQGWSVRKGEHAAARIFSPIVKNEIDPMTGREEPRVVAYRGAPLFNAAQIDGIPPMREIPEHERLPKTAELDAIAQQMGVDILHSGTGAFYSSGRDRIQMPPRDTFTDQHGYDATKAHELSHATGHESRLDRDSLRQYTTIKGRATEEMTAEIGAYILSTRLGVPFMGNNPDMTDAQHAAYLTTWAKDLSPDERRAAIEQGIKASLHLEKQLELARENGLVMGLRPAREEATPELAPTQNTVQMTPAEKLAWGDKEVITAIENEGGYQRVLVDPEKALKLQDILDSALGERAVNVRNSLRNDCEWGALGLGELVHDDAVLTTHARRVGAGSNATQLHWQIAMPEIEPGGKPLIIDDFMDRSAQDMAEHITSRAIEMQRGHGQGQSQEKTDPIRKQMPGVKSPTVDQAIQRGDHIAYRSGPGNIQDGFVREVAGNATMTVVPMNRDPDGSIPTWHTERETVAHGQVVAHTPTKLTDEVKGILATWSNRTPDKDIGTVRRAAYKSLSKSQFVEMVAAQVVKDKPEIEKIQAERATANAAFRVEAATRRELQLAADRARLAASDAEKESRFADAFDHGKHELHDARAYPLNPGDYVAYTAASGNAYELVVKRSAALPADPKQRGEVIYQRIERGGLSGTGKYEHGPTVAGDISKDSIMNHIKDFLPERANIAKANSPLLDAVLDKRMQEKQAAEEHNRVARRSSMPVREDPGLER
jgi:antirestriction protein ArdC